MSFIDHIYLLERVHFHIEHKATGTPKEFAACLGISERKLYRILEELRDLGADIRYNQERTSYIYYNDVRINILVQIDRFDSIRTKGGCFFVISDPLPIMAV